MRKTSIAALLAVFTYAPAHGQQALDTIDYKAAYCVGRLHDLQVPQPSSSSPDSVNEWLRKLTDKVENARTRLRAYMLPRMAYLDGTAILATMQVGAKEQQQYASAMRECVAKASASGSIADAARISSSCANDAGWPKLKECEDAAFLPF
jgi:hypothetical protein